MASDPKCAISHLMKGGLSDFRIYFGQCPGPMGECPAAGWLLLLWGGLTQNGSPAGVHLYPGCIWSVIKYGHGHVLPLANYSNSLTLYWLTTSTNLHVTFFYSHFVLLCIVKEFKLWLQVKIEITADFGWVLYRTMDKAFTCQVHYQASNYLQDGVKTSY